MKRARLLSDCEIESASVNAWGKIMIEPHENIQCDTMNNYQTIAIQNPATHLEFSAIKLNLQPTKRPDKLFEVIDSENSSEDDSSEECEEFKRIEIRKDKIKPSEFYDKFVERTTEQCAQELKAPQRSEEWLEARKYCITASQFGSAIGCNPYQTPDSLVAEKVWYTFQGNVACDWGTEHEPHAKESFCQWISNSNSIQNFQFKEENLMKFSDMPWLGVSPDGLITYFNTKTNQIQTDLVEFKCPAYLRNTMNHPYAKHPNNIPPQYNAQMQGIMGFLNHHNYHIQQSWFVVWQPHQTWITKVPYEQTYYEEELYPKVKDWYFLKYLPALTHKYNGILEYGEIHPSEEIIIS